MKTSVTASIDERTMKVVYALMEQRHMTRSQAIDFLALQGMLRLKELNESESEQEEARA